MRDVEPAGRRPFTVKRHRKTGILSSLQNRLTLIVFYDGWCPLCKDIATRTSRWDWFGLIQWVSFRDPLAVSHYGLDDKKCEERICCQSCVSSRVYEGVETLWRVCVRIPVYWVFAPFLAAGKTAGLAQPLYDWIARRRLIAPLGHK